MYLKSCNILILYSAAVHLSTILYFVLRLWFLQGFQCQGLLASDGLHHPWELCRRFAVATGIYEEMHLTGHHPDHPVHVFVPPLIVLGSVWWLAL